MYDLCNKKYTCTGVNGYKKGNGSLQQYFSLFFEYHSTDMFLTEGHILRLCFD